jgi:hypothetical protein
VIWQCSLVCGVCVWHAHTARARGAHGLAWHRRDQTTGCLTSGLAQVLLRGAKSTPMASSGGGALSYLANEASYDEDEVEAARERIAALATRVQGSPPGLLARRWAAFKGYAIGLYELVLALIYKVRR